MAHARTTRQGEVFLVENSSSADVLEGHVEKLDDGRWQAQCALDDSTDHSFIESTRGAVVTALHEHFVKSHTTLDV